MHSKKSQQIQNFKFYLAVFFAGIFFSLFVQSCQNRGNSPLQTYQNVEAVLEYEIKAALGEGAIWNYQTKELYWVDILSKQLHIFNPATRVNRSFTTPSPIGTVVPLDGDEAIIALENGIYLINTLTGELEQFSDVEADMPGNRFNDGKCDPAGRFWVGSMHYDQSEPVASLYMISGDGTATRMLDSITISNGIVWTKDQKTMYYIDTPTGAIRAYDFDVKTGTISNERDAVIVPKTLGYPDGMAIDEEDMVWVGMWNGDAVVRFNPKTGKVLSKIKVPAHNVTACAFGGENLDTLYITTSSVDMTEEEVHQYPLAGSIFKVAPGVKGVITPLFKKDKILKKQ